MGGVGWWSDGGVILIVVVGCRCKDGQRMEGEEENQRRVCARRLGKRTRTIGEVEACRDNENSDFGE
jgi:hypothetical protein